jgi:putative transposase
MYFVTICTTDRCCWFGEVANSHVVLSKMGELVQDAWRRVVAEHPGVELDEFVIMPNHLHGLVGLSTAAGSLSAIIGAFKSKSVQIARSSGLLQGRTLWQRGFHDHVVRDEAGLDRVREYIQNNPLRWHLDRENPAKIGARNQRAGTSPAPTG